MNLANWIASLSPGLRVAALLLPEADQQRAFDAYKARCADMTAERLALEAWHEHHPLELLRQSDECVIRNVSDKRIRGLKQRGELPAVMVSRP